MSKVKSAKKSGGKMAERQFLTETRTPAGERARLNPLYDEFANAFMELHDVGPAATLIQCQKIGQFPVILMGAKFWGGLRKWGQFMMKQSVYTKDELKFGHVTDSPKEAVQIILRSLPPAARKQLKP